MPLRLDLKHPESRFPYVLIVPQARTERLLEARARALGVEISRGAEVVGLRQDQTGVEVVVEGPGGLRSERVDYVVGCDGAHSAVRRLLGVGFAGASYDTHIMLADVHLSETLSTSVTAYVGRDGVGLLPPFGDGWYRAVIWDRSREHVPLDEPLGIDEVRQSLRRIAGTDFGIQKMRWSTRFLSERRQAERYRVGRVFLAGDAACPPSDRISRTTLEPASSSTSAMTTVAPSRASRRAVARPIPAPAPVTRATFSSSSTTLLLPHRGLPRDDLALSLTYNGDSKRHLCRGSGEKACRVPQDSWSFSSGCRPSRASRPKSWPRSSGSVGAPCSGTSALSRRWACRCVNARTERRIRAAEGSQAALAVSNGGRGAGFDRFLRGTPALLGLSF